MPPNRQEGEYEFEAVFPAGVTSFLKQHFTSGRVRVALPPPLPGDADLSGVVDIDDLVCILDFMLANGFCPSETNANADGQGAIDHNDLLSIIRSIVQ